MKMEMKVMQVKVNMMRLLKVMSWHFSWLQITVINCCLQQPKRCETGSCDSCQAQRCLQLQPLLAMPPKKATTETKGNAKPKAKAPGRTWRSTIGIATSVQIPKILEQWVLHLTEACDSSSGTWLPERRQSSCAMGELRGVWLAPVLHSRIMHGAHTV